MVDAAHDKQLHQLVLQTIEKLQQQQQQPPQQHRYYHLRRRHEQQQKQQQEQQQLIEQGTSCSPGNMSRRCMQRTLSGQAGRP